MRKKITRLRGFFKYFGGKHRLAPKYPAPRHDLIIEPFAGSAAYATYHALTPGRRVILQDLDPHIDAVWRFLIASTPEDIRKLPCPERLDGISDIYDLVKPSTPPGAVDLIRYWFRTGSPTPRDTPSPWAKTPEYADRFWGEHVRSRIERQVPFIHHWQFACRSYEDSPDVEATWFIDPPYEKAGGAYVRDNNIDYDELGAWCRSRKGLVIVCEQEGAKWLPFQPLAEVRANVNVAVKEKGKGLGTRVSREVFCVLENGIDITSTFPRKSAWKAASPDGEVVEDEQGE